MGFYWRLNGSKFPQVNWTLLSILADISCSLDNLHPSHYFRVLQSLYRSFSDSTKSTNYNRYKCYFHDPQFFNTLASSRYLYLFLHSINLTLWSAGKAKSTILEFFFLLLITLVYKNKFLVWRKNGNRCFC